MRLLPTADQKAMSHAIRDTLVKESSAEVLRASWGSQPPARLWQSLADLGLFGLTVSEAYGGLGLDERDAIGALEETGRAAVPGPVVETFAACHALQAAPTSGHAATWLAHIASGEATVSLGLGAHPFVPSADSADLLLLQHGDELHAVRTGDTKLEHQSAMDGNRRLYSVEWTPSPDSLVARGDAGESLIAGVRDRMLLGTSAQLVGLSRRLLEMAVDHVKLREQFGRPLGSFQAVQHRLADVAVAVEFAAPVVARASCSMADGSASVFRDVAMAKVFASEAAERSAYSSLQVHGAIGYTREHDLHLYSMRAWSLALAHGDAQTHRARVAVEILGDNPAPRYP
jgi:alkylation response protein AidB-like acyl-CoA dehydrogenase